MELDFNGRGFEDEEYGCLFCKTGTEEKLIKEVPVELGCRLLVAKKKTRRREGKQFFIVEERLFPGYVFFKAPKDFSTALLSKHSQVLRVLKNQDDNWYLFDTDRQFAELLFESNGIIGLSKAYFEGQRIRIVDGPMKNYEGKITKVNKRFQCGQIEIQLDNRAFKIWLSFEKVQC